VDLHREILVRADTGGRAHAFTQDCHDAGIRFSVGYEVDERVCEAILAPLLVALPIPACHERPPNAPIPGNDLGVGKCLHASRMQFGCLIAR
jgi:hypothetical protein